MEGKYPPGGQAMDQSMKYTLPQPPPGMMPAGQPPGNYYPGGQDAPVQQVWGLRYRARAL